MMQGLPTHLVEEIVSRTGSPAPLTVFKSLAWTQRLKETYAKAREAQRAHWQLVHAVAKADLQECKASLAASSGGQLCVYALLLSSARLRRLCEDGEASSTEQLHRLRKIQDAIASFLLPDPCFTRLQRGVLKTLYSAGVIYEWLETCGRSVAGDAGKCTRPFMTEQEAQRIAHTMEDRKPYDQLLDRVFERWWPGQPLCHASADGTCPFYREHGRWAALREVGLADLII